MKRIQKSKKKSPNKKSIKASLRPAFLKRKNSEEKFKEAISEVPKITDQTITEHREALLSEARKFIYPLSHSKHRLVRISVYLFIVALILFFIFCYLDLYVFQSSSGFIYSVSEVIPFPVAKAGPSYISFHSYLFELRRNMHYYESQQNVNFANSKEKAQLNNLKQQAMDKVITDAYTKQLAKKYNISVSSKEVDNEISILQQQNKLGNNDKVLASVLRDYWGWTITDFREELTSELLQQKVAAYLDKSTFNLATSVDSMLQKGSDFSTLALQYSTDQSTKNNGGQYASPITTSSNFVSPIIISELFKMKVGQISGVINTGFNLEILKVDSINSGSITASHIEFNIKPITYFINPLEKQSPPSQYITI